MICPKSQKKGGENMCTNCGCQMWDDDMGHPDNDTLTRWAKAAIASDQDGKTTLEHQKEAAEKITPEELDKKIAELKAQAKK
jgi:hypothetical protein